MIKTAEELFSGEIRAIDIPEWGLKVSKLLKSKDKKVLFSGEVWREGRDIWVEGEIFYEVKRECRRCMKEFFLKSEAKFKRKISPAEFEIEEGEIHLTQDDLDTDFYTDGMIDMKDYIFMLAEGFADTYPLCSENCKGLCKVCGTNLNESECEHKKQVEVKDPPKVEVELEEEQSGKTIGDMIEMFLQKSKRGG